MIRKSCIEGLQAIAQVSDLVSPSFALDYLEKHIITPMLLHAKPWELIIKLEKDEFQFAVDVLQEVSFLLHCKYCYDKM